MIRRVSTALFVVVMSLIGPSHAYGSQREIIADGFSGSNLDTTVWKVDSPGISYTVSGGLWNVTDVSELAPDTSGWHRGNVSATFPVLGSSDFTVEIAFDWQQIAYQGFRFSLMTPVGVLEPICARFEISSGPSHYIAGFSGDALIFLQNFPAPVNGPRVFTFRRQGGVLSFAVDGVVKGTSPNSCEISTLALNFWRWDNSEFGTVAIDSIYASRSSRVIHVPADQPTIQAGIDASQDGDTVLVAPGSYPENFSFTNKEVHLLSELGAERTSLGPAATVSVENGADAQITGFTFSSGAFTVIAVGSGAHLSLSYCRFLDFVTDWCVVIYNGTSARISHCLFALQQRQGVVLNTGTLDFINNTVDGGSWGIRWGEGPSLIQNSIFTGLSQCPWYQQSSGGSITTLYNDISNCTTACAPSPGFGSLAVDPGYVCSRTNYYELQSGSPCIDAGDPNPLYNDPDGSRCDMGAYPFNPDSINPVIVGIADVPHDQGGKVTVRWGRSKYDISARGGITEYSIWRAIPHGGLFAAAQVTARPNAEVGTPRPTVRVLTTSVGTYEWEWIGSVPGHYFEAYSFTATALYDSTAQSNGKHYFLVSAHSPDGIHFYDSEPDSGYSVDNLAPPAPTNLAMAMQSSGLRLQWGASAAPDVSDYRVYRDTTPGFSIPGLAPLSIRTDTVLIDNAVVPGKRYYYRVTASDYAGNESAPSNQASGVFCVCPHQGDLNGDGVIDVFDVIGVIETAFSGGIDPQDPGCPKTRGDADNNGVTDVFDVIYLINYVFSGGPAPVVGCVAAARSEINAGGRN